MPSLDPMRRSPRAALLVASVLFVEATSGCVSQEYVISKTELQRLASLPPEARGARVRVVQELGDRRSDALDYQEPPPPYEAAAQPGPDVDVEIRLDGGDVRLERDMVPGRAPSPGGSPSAGFKSAGSSSGWHGQPASSGWHGQPASSGWHGQPASSGFHGRPPSHVGGGGGGGGGINFGGGGKDAAAALVIVAVVLVGIALVAGATLVAGEGVRYDGYVQMAPEQPLHVQDPSGHKMEIPLAALTPEQAVRTVQASVMDDEGYGIRRLDRAPLDRKGGAFRLELGSSAFNYGLARVVGPAAHIQLGGFPQRNVGLLLDIGLSGGTPACCDAPPDTAPGSEPTVVRHSLGLEVDLFPVSVQRLHVGVFGKGGVAFVAATAGAMEDGALAGGGGLLELELTSRLALSFRAGANAAHFPSGWSTAGTITGGVSVY